MSNTQKKKAKRKVRKKASSGSSGMTLEAIARALGESTHETVKAFEEMQALGLVKFNGAGRPVLSEQALLSMAMHEETGVFVPPHEL